MLVWLVLIAAQRLAVAEQPSFNDVVTSLGSQDPAARVEALRALREGGHPEAIRPVAALIADPIDAVQLEAIDTELSLFLAEPIQGRVRRRVALVIEVRDRARAERAFEAGPMAVLPRQAPPDLVAALASALFDDHDRVRVEAAWVLGIVAGPPLDRAVADRLVAVLQDPNPELRAAAARTLGRLQVKPAGDALVHAINDPAEKVRLAAILALGDLREPRAVQALSEQFAYYQRGRQALAAIDALARISHATSLPLFKERLGDSDPAIRRFAAEGLGRAGDARAAADLEAMVGVERSDEAMFAMAFALQRAGRPYLDRLLKGLASPRTEAQVRGYLLELAPANRSALTSYLSDPEPRIRTAAADVLGFLGDPTVVPALDALRQDRDAAVAAAAIRAIDRIKLVAAAAPDRGVRLQPNVGGSRS